MHSVTHSERHIQSFKKKFDVGAPDECWIYKGYAKRVAPKRSKPGRYGDHCHMYAHRFAYEVFVGPIPDGMTIDHTCFNTLCVNPAHLEAVSKNENTRRFICKVWADRNQRPVFTPEALTKAQELRASGHSQSSIAAVLGCHPSSVSRLLSRRYTDARH